MWVKVNKDNFYIGFILFSTIFFIKYILIKPVYIIMFLVILFGYYFKKYKINMSYILSSYLFLCFLIFHLFYMNSDPGMILNAILSILIFPILYYIFLKSNFGYVKIFLNFSILYFILEVTWRLAHPIYEINNVETSSSDGGWYYPFKFSSFVFTDSNFVALHIICLIFIALLSRMKWQAFCLFILMFLTFSRSGIAGSVLVFFYFIVDQTKYKKMIKPLFFILLIVSFLYLAINISLLTDGSFLSKFHIYDVSINYAANHFTLNNYFFGIGLSHSYELISIGAHSIWLILLFETGVMGLIIYFVYFSLFYSKFFMLGPKAFEKLSFFFLVFFMMGFSLGLYLFPIMVLTIACILTLSDRIND